MSSDIHFTSRKLNHKSITYLKIAVFKNFFFQDFGPPDRVIPIGTMSHTCQDDLVLKVTQTDVPYFNAPIYLENKQQVNKLLTVVTNSG